MALARMHSECGGVVWSGVAWMAELACVRACVRKLPNDDKMLMPPPPKTDGVRWRSAKVSGQSGASVRPLFSPAARVVSGQQQPRSPKMAAAVCNVACIAWHRLGHVELVYFVLLLLLLPAGSRWHSRAQHTGLLKQRPLLPPSTSASWGKKRCGGQRRIHHLRD